MFDQILYARCSMKQWNKLEWIDQGRFILIGSSIQNQTKFLLHVYKYNVGFRLIFKYCRLWNTFQIYWFGFASKTVKEIKLCDVSRSMIVSLIRFQFNFIFSGFLHFSTSQRNLWICFSNRRLLFSGEGIDLNFVCKFILKNHSSRIKSFSYVTEFQSNFLSEDSF